MFSSVTSWDSTHQVILNMFSTGENLVNTIILQISEKFIALVQHDLSYDEACWYVAHLIFFFSRKNYGLDFFSDSTEDIRNIRDSWKMPCVSANINMCQSLPHRCEGNTIIGRHSFEQFLWEGTLIPANKIFFKVFTHSCVNFLNGPEEK